LTCSPRYGVTIAQTKGSENHLENKPKPTVFTNEADCYQVKNRK